MRSDFRRHVRLDENCSKQLQAAKSSKNDSQMDISIRGVVILTIVVFSFCKSKFETAVLKT